MLLYCAKLCGLISQEIKQTSKRVCRYDKLCYIVKASICYYTIISLNVDINPENIYTNDLRSCTFYAFLALNYACAIFPALDYHGDLPQCSLKNNRGFLYIAQIILSLHNAFIVTMCHKTATVSLLSFVSTVPWYWCMMCLFDFLPALSFMYKTSYPSLECACGGRAERPQMVYANDNASLIHQIKFRRSRYPWAHPLWFVEWSSTWWSMHLWPGLPK